MKRKCLSLLAASTDRPGKTNSNALAVRSLRALKGGKEVMESVWPQILFVLEVYEVGQDSISNIKSFSSSRIF